MRIDEKDIIVEPQHLVENGDPGPSTSSDKEITGRSTALGESENETRRKSYRDQGTSTQSIIDNYNTVIKQGPTEICSCCGGTWFPVQVNRVQRSILIAKGLTADFLTRCLSLDTDSDILKLCATCHWDIKKAKVPKLSISNGFRYADIPECLQKLNRIEERLLSVRHPFQQIWTVAGANGQFRHKGAVNNIPVDFDTTVTQLPRSLSDTNIIPLQLAKKMSSVNT
ncbi:hypothetical protein INT47_000393 [Mucor saturninus]|uniref:DUF6570 domain-containing protein n=1 Tax=Mucor saturninus TaxID=64648 RepID=A0A8H7QTM9_9FUNG|nr:hypothetical protein INT47_000393 [Mucor saturninus]